MACTSNADDAVYQLMTDETFLREYRTEPRAALETFDLSQAEMNAFLTGDEAALARVQEDDVQEAPLVTVVNLF